MNSEMIKNVWKENAVKQIENYTDSDIKSIVLKSARKAIGLSYPRIGLLSYLTLLTLFCIWAGLTQPPQMQIFWIVSSVILLGVIFISLLSLRKMQKQTPDVNLKEWCESRIKEFDRSINRKKSYWFALSYGLGTLLLLLLCTILIRTADFTFQEAILPFVIGFVCIVICGEVTRRRTMQQMIKTRTELQELVDQLQE